MAALPLLTPAQERFVLDEVNDSAAVYPRESCLHELFAAQVAKTPDAVAIVDRRGSLTYAELDRHSTRLAQEMLGVCERRHGRIAIAVDRSRLLPVALLAALKSGHAYVPLDASQPIERLKQIALAAQIDGLVCQDDRIAGIAPYAFALRADRLPLDEVLQRHPLPKVTADATAYVLFTSGSTGTPKGVEVGHRSLTNLITDVVRRLELTASDVTIGSSAITFDVAATELFAPLVSGGRLVLSEADEVRTGVELIHLAGESAATLMQATPTLWRMLLDAGFTSWPGLRMITVGEAISRATVDRLIEGGGRLWNLYGPTETTIYSSGHEMLPGETGVTIGRPLANQRLYVLDDRDQLAPPGTVGNLFIGGDGLAKGYFDRSDLTDAAFRALALAAAAPVSSPPRTPLEDRIAAVWAAAIGLPTVGVHDPLFALGADSLQVFRIAAQLDREGIAVSARELMKNPTVAALAQAIDGTPAASREANVRRGPSLADFRHGARRRTLNS
jgi:amino acid adenylation domain-containing protein